MDERRDLVDREELRRRIAMVEAVARAIRDRSPQDTDGDFGGRLGAIRAARAVLSVPAVRDALARDAQVREELEVYRTALGLACSDGWSDGASAMESYIETARTRIAAARHEPDDSDIMPGSEFDGPVVL